MKDERIETTINHIARRVFLIWYVLTLISLNYRLFILKQHPRYFWDFIAIFFIGALYGFIAFANKGVFDHHFKSLWLTIGIVNLIVLFAVFFIMGQIHSVGDVGVFLIVVLVAYLPAMGLVIGIGHFLNRRWKRKEGIDDEK